MRLWLPLLVLFYVELVSIGAVKNCCSPVRWESQNRIVETFVVNGSTEFTQRIEQMSVDSSMKKISFLASITKQGNTTFTHIIQDFQARTEYQLYGNPPNRCLQESLAPWSDMCVPDNATLVSSAYHGAAGLVTVDTYTFNYGHELTYFMSVDHSDCSPIEVNVYGSLSNVPRMISKTYSNFTVGIKDKSVFDVPVFCHH